MHYNCIRPALAHPEVAEFGDSIWSDSDHEISNTFMRSFLNLIWNLPSKSPVYWKIAPLQQSV